MEIEDEWKQEKRQGEKLDFKIEKDQVGSEPPVESYSLDDKEDAKGIEEVVEEKEPIEAIFSRNQEDLVEAKAGANFDWDNLRPLGPVKVLKWELATSTLDLVAERWNFGDRSPTLEVSTKVAGPTAPETVAELVDFMKEKGSEQETNPETQTEEVLEYFSFRN